ncbi:MAG: alpha-mannosidase [Bacteroidetes bacterium]|nr:alpha-mannosidase [Bacteroidota bacterium]
MAIDLLDQIHPFIKDSIYPARIIISDWKMKEGDIPDAASVSFKDKSWTPIRIPFQWGKCDKTYWFRQTITITEQFAGKPLVLLLDFPEALLYLDGKPFHGINQYHNEILICEKARVNQKYVLAVQAYSGRKHEHNIFGVAELAVLDTTARRLDSALTVLHDLEKQLEHGSDESKEIREIIRRTLIFLKYFKPGSEEYPNAIRRAYNFLLNTLETEHRTSLPGLIRLIGFSHIDTAWMWSLQETIRKCGRTFSTMLRLMEEFPEFKYSQSQPVLYDFTKKYYPELYKQIKQRIAEGRWETVCAMWTEADCNIPNGESIVRQVLYGKRFLKQEFGTDPNTLWLPDTYGFNAALPQIMEKSGIKNFYTSKLSWNDTTEFPYTTFFWQGIDKSKVKAHFSPLGLDAQITPKCLLKSGVPAMEETPVSPILQTYGYGDSGGGPTKENLEYAVILKTIVGLPASQISTVQEFFKQLEETPAEYPTWANELYLETHRGAYTTHAWLKKENRECEKQLYTAELLSVLALLHAKSASARHYPQAELEQAWKKLLVNQHHELITGGGIEGVYKDVQQEYKDVRKICSEIITRCFEGLTQTAKKSKKEFVFTIFNPLNWKRNAYIELNIKTREKHLSVFDADNKTVEHQVLGRTKDGEKILCYVKDIPSFGFKKIIVTAQQSAVNYGELWKTAAHGIETPFFRVRLDSKGAFSSLYAKHLRRELVEKGKRANSLTTFRDTPKQWEARNIDAEFEKHKTELWHVKQIKIVENGPLRAAIHVEMKTENGSYLSQNLYFYHQTPRIDFQTSVKWQEEQTLLKAVFPLNMKNPDATYEIQFGALKRASKAHTDEERAKFEVPAQQWADMSDAKYGVSLLNDCKYGYDGKLNTLRLTLLRSPHYPRPVDMSHSDENVIDQGEHAFNYSLYPHPGDWMKGQTVQHARELNIPVIILPNAVAYEIQPLIESSKPNIIVDSVKKAEDSGAVIIRMHEAHGLPTDALLHFGADISGIMECNLLENDDKPHKVSKSKLMVKFKPFEIRTLKLSAKPPKKKR